MAKENNTNTGMIENLVSSSAFEELDKLDAKLLKLASTMERIIEMQPIIRQILDEQNSN